MKNNIKGFLRVDYGLKEIFVRSEDCPLKPKTDFAICFTSDHPEGECSHHHHILKKGKMISKLDTEVEICCNYK